MKKKIKLLIVFGTRPEAIKLIPLIEEIQKHEKLIELLICNTSQHKDMLEPILKEFNVLIDYDFNLMSESQSLVEITNGILIKLTDLLNKSTPDYVIVHGDTTTAFSSALASFYCHIKVLHIEAGLRTGNFLSPFPEEFNRSAISIVASHHFTPTQLSYSNLIKQGISRDKISITGNTIVDLVKQSYRHDIYDSDFEWLEGSKFILFTAHRRENVINYEQMFTALRDILIKHSSLKAIFPVHKNPNVRKVVYRILGEVDNLRLIEPTNVTKFHNLIARSYLIMSDSGGIQEEAPTFGVPVVLMRESTERPEVIDNGALLSGTTYGKIFSTVDRLVSDQLFYIKNKPKLNPFGNGDAAIKILKKILDLNEDSSV